MAKKRELSLGAVLILHAMARGYRYGFEILEQTGLTTGTVYPTLDRLESLALARSNWEDSDQATAEKRPPRRYFDITEAGKLELIRALDRYKALASVTIDGIVHPSGSRSV